MVTEYHDPVGKADYLSLVHLERYLFACATLAPGRRVLDIACGPGYGTGMLLQRGCDAIGADYDEELVCMARSAWGAERFLVANALALPFADASFDVVVTFETIEHVSDGAAFLNEMRRVLRPGGLFMCSTPNIRYTTHPVYHLKEYKPEEFFELVRRAFGNVKRYGQYFRLRDYVRDRGRLVKDRLMSFAVGLGLLRLAKLVLPRGIVNRLRGGAPAAAAQAPQPQPSAPRSPVGPPADRFYRVREHSGERALRVMVAVATKENAS